MQNTSVHLDVLFYKISTNLEPNFLVLLKIKLNIIDEIG